MALASTSEKDGKTGETDPRRSSGNERATERERVARKKTEKKKEKQEKYTDKALTAGTEREKEGTKKKNRERTKGRKRRRKKTANDGESGRWEALARAYSEEHWWGSVYVGRSGVHLIS